MAMSKSSVNTRGVDEQTLERMTRNEADMAFKKRVRTIFEWINPQDDDLILDMPCGRGFYLNMFRYVSGCKLIGAELDWPVLLKAQRNVGHLPDIALNNANIYALPYPSDTFDGVILAFSSRAAWWLSPSRMLITPSGGTQLIRLWKRCSIRISAAARWRESGRIMCGCIRATNCARVCWRQVSLSRRNAPLRITAFRSSTIWFMAWGCRCSNPACCLRQWRTRLTARHLTKTTAACSIQ